MRFALLATLVLPLGGSPGIRQPLPAASPEPVTVFVVRHAEKATDDPRDPNLSEEGRHRATELARVLGDAGVTALFASEFRRTQQTVAPLAQARGLTTTVVGAGAMDSLVARLDALPAGSRAVVASHSNLVSLIVKQLCGAEVKPLTDADYDRLYVVTLTGKGTGTVAVLRYGPP